MSLRLTSAGRDYRPEVPHNVAAWGAIREVIRHGEGEAARAAVLAVLQFCAHPDQRLNPNTAFLDYALRNGWLEERYGEAHP